MFDGCSDDRTTTTPVADALPRHANVLGRLNRDAGANFDPSAFQSPWPEAAIRTMAPAGAQESLWSIPSALTFARSYRLSANSTTDLTPTTNSTSTKQHTLSLHAFSTRSPNAIPSCDHGLGLTAVKHAQSSVCRLHAIKTQRIARLCDARHHTIGIFDTSGICL